MRDAVHLLTAARLPRLAAAGLISIGLGLGTLSPIQAAPVSSTRDFTLVSVAGNTAPTTLTVQRSWNGPLFTIDVSTSTTIVRRFNGVSNLSELNPGDRLEITGAGLGHHTITATNVQDDGIQVGFTQINATVSYVASDFSRMAVHVSANEGANAAFGVGSTILVDITPTTPVSFLNGQNGTVQQLRPGMVLTFWGLSDHAAQLVIRPHDLTQLLATQANALTKVAPNDSTPA